VAEEEEEDKNVVLIVVEEVLVVCAKEAVVILCVFFEDVFEADGREFAFTRAYIEEKDDGLIIQKWRKESFRDEKNQQLFYVSRLIFNNIYNLFSFLWWERAKDDDDNDGVLMMRRDARGLSLSLSRIYLFSTKQAA